MNTSLANGQRLQVFVAVADYLSFTRAARRLHISQPSVSVHMRELERAVGVPLFDHRKSQLALTDAGRELYGHVRKILNEMEEAEKAISGLSNAIAGHLVLNAVWGWEGYLVPVILDFQLKHPAVTFTVTFERDRDVSDAVADKRAHIGFITRDPKDARLDTSVVFELNRPVVVFTHPQHVLTSARSISLDMLDEFPFVSYPSRPGSPLEDHLIPLGWRPKPVLEIESVDGVIKAVELGIGVHISQEPNPNAPRTDTRLEAIRDGRIVMNLVKVPPLNVAFMMLTSRSRTRSKAEAALIEHVKAHFSARSGDNRSVASGA